MFEFLWPIHPKVVHFPIALFITAFVLEVLSLLIKKDFFHCCAVCLYTVAALVTPLIVRTGLWEAERLHLSHPLLDQHQRYALWAMWISLMSLPFFWYIMQNFQKMFRVIFIVILLVVSCLVIVAGHKGGQMVYEYGVGVSN